MVSTLSIIAMVISVILCFGTPILFYFLVRRKANLLLTALLAGVVGFFVMQILIRIPLLSVLRASTNFYGINIFLLALILGFSAALFETFARVITCRLFMKNDTRFTAGIAHGIGHGGVEAIMLVGLGQITNIVFSFMINNGTFTSVLGNSSDIIDLQTVLIETPASLFLLGGIERVLTLIFHIALSVLVFYAFRIKKKYPIILVLLIHTLLDSTVVMMQYYGMNLYMIELFIFIVVLIMVYVTYLIYKQYKTMNEEGETDV